MWLNQDGMYFFLQLSTLCKRVVRENLNSNFAEAARL